MYADPDTGLINAEGFRSVLQCLRLCPSEAFVNRVFKDHDKDRKCEVTVIINLFFVLFVLSVVFCNVTIKRQLCICKQFKRKLIP